MKNLEELYQEIASSEETRDALLKAAETNTLSEFLKAQGVETTPEEFSMFLKQKKCAGRCELSDSEAENVAGGFSWIKTIELVYDLIHLLKKN